MTVCYICIFLVKLDVVVGHTCSDSENLSVAQSCMQVEFSYSSIHFYADYSTGETTNLDHANVFRVRITNNIRD